MKLLVMKFSPFSWDTTEFKLMVWTQGVVVAPDLNICAFRTPKGLKEIAKFLSKLCNSI
jgi:hypothetical protein